MGTYTIRLDNARQVSTLLDALNTHEASLNAVAGRLEDVAAIQTIVGEITRAKELRKLLLSANQDAVTA